MADEKAPKQEQINEYINENLKVLLSDFAKDEMPDEITDLLMVLRAQDLEAKGKE